MPVKTMARPFSSAAAMTSSSRIEPPGWMTAVAPASAAASSAVGEREESIRRDDRALGERRALADRRGRVSRFERGDARRIDAAHLARADADGGAALGVDDGVRLDVLGDHESKLEIGEFVPSGRALGDDLQLGGSKHAVVARLHEEAAGERADDEALLARIGQPARGQQAQVLLGRKDRLGLGRGIGRDDHLGEDLGDLLGRSLVERLAERDDAAVGAHRIAAQRSEVGFLQRGSDRRAARVGVLDDGDRRLLGAKLGHQLEGGVGVVEVVVGQLLALVLHCGRDAKARVACA